MSDIHITDLERSISSIGLSGLSYAPIVFDGVKQEGVYPTATSLRVPTRYRSELRKIKNKINASLAIHDHMPELTLRELRLLAYDHDLPVNNKSIYLRLLEAIQTSGAHSCLLYKNLLFVYFKRYRYFIESDTVFLPLKELWLSWAEGPQDDCDICNIAESLDVYFCKEAPLKIAACVLDNKAKAPDTPIDVLMLRHHLLPGTDDLLTETYDSIVRLCLDGFRNRIYLNVLLYEVLPPRRSDSQIHKGVIDKTPTTALVSELIRHLDSDARYRATCQRTLNRYFLTSDRFGDPRKSCCIDNWNGVDEQSVRIVTRWLVEDDIVFFFKFLSDDGSDAYSRRSFWLHFAGLIRTVRIFISKYHYNAHREVIENAKEDGRELSSLHCDGGRLNSSCIVFDLDNRLYAVEFTEPETAVYLYKKEAFTLDLTQETLNMSDLKKTDAPTATQNAQMVQFYYNMSYPALRFYHNANWQPFVEKYLSLYNIKLAVKKSCDDIPK
ncbi:hypothetical protein MBAV_002644 [Candidatus Magnetobacterium bavaricum]|uniref:Zorya protein ZorC EH domain-containing protein n=1 Tax=Candidatus Magnetobacterium bavaricum TaxID=29290 RepID=A0A0F3GWU8_9BACT|nr:hypothetical protein MBAV_004483 [Candidatus Magnetobacterium bavaricum]KJU85163.1 hypothetical protein MBAV_002644 [Candidatus Magnetobacterium bavaricum]